MRISELGDPKADFSPSSLQKKLVSGMLKQPLYGKKGRFHLSHQPDPLATKDALDTQGLWGPVTAWSFS